LIIDEPSAIALIRFHGLSVFFQLITSPPPHCFDIAALSIISRFISIPPSQPFLLEIIHLRHHFHSRWLSSHCRHIDIDCFHCRRLVGHFFRDFHFLFQFHIAIVFNDFLFSIFRAIFFFRFMTRLMMPYFDCFR